MSPKKLKPPPNKFKRGRSRNQNRWPLWLALGGIALIAIAFVAFWRGNSSPKATIEVTGAPSLKVDQEKVDLGDVKLGVPVKVSFQLTNVGDKLLRFTDTPYVEIKEGC
jgi:hypothetical protein